jgi:RNA polymerase sigma-70 factor (sigma-E family)
MRRQERDADFTAYVDANRTRLRRLAYSLCGDWHAADDIVQTSLAKLYVVWPKVVKTSNQDAYVRRTIARATIDETRRPWRRERSGLDGLDPVARLGADGGDRSDLVDALMRLPEMQRKTVVLRHWLGLSVAETAADLGLAEGTVKSHTFRALAALHEALADASERED